MESLQDYAHAVKLRKVFKKYSEMCLNC